jgi:hypothetical protein
MGTERERKELDYTGPPWIFRGSDSAEEKKNLI